MILRVVIYYIVPFPVTGVSKKRAIDDGELKAFTGMHCDYIYGIIVTLNPHGIFIIIGGIRYCVYKPCRQFSRCKIVLMLNSVKYFR